MGMLKDMLDRVDPFIGKSPCFWASAKMQFHFAMVWIGRAL